MAPARMSTPRRGIDDLVYDLALVQMWLLKSTKNNQNSPYSSTSMAPRAAEHAVQPDSETCEKRPFRTHVMHGDNYASEVWDRCLVSDVIDAPSMGRRGRPRVDVTRTRPRATFAATLSPPPPQHTAEAVPKVCSAMADSQAFTLLSEVLYDVSSHLLHARCQ